MADLIDLAEKLNNVHVVEPDKPICDNIQNKLVSVGAEIVKQNKNDSLNEKKNTDIKCFFNTADKKNEVETDVLISSATPNSSYLNNGQTVKENDNVITKENVTESVSDIKEFLEKNNSEFETKPIESLIIDIQNNLLSESTLNASKRKQILLKITLKAKKYVLITLTQLEEHYAKLLQQKLKLLAIEREILQNIHNALNGTQPKVLTENVDQIVDESRRVFSQHVEVYSKCKTVLEAFAQNIDKRVGIEHVPRTILEQHKAYFSTLEDISSKKFLLESSIKASEEFEKCIENFIKLSTLDSGIIIKLLLGAIDKANFACTELSLFGNMLKKLFDCIEFCVRAN